MKDDFDVFVEQEERREGVLIKDVFFVFFPAPNLKEVVGFIAKGGFTGDKMRASWGKRHSLSLVQIFGGRVLLDSYSMPIHAGVCSPLIFFFYISFSKRTRILSLA